MRIQKNTGEYRRMQENTGEYKRIQENTREYKRIQENIYLLLTEFEGRTVSYGPIFFLLDYISSVCLKGSGTILIHAEWLQISDAPRKRNESMKWFSSR